MNWVIESSRYRVISLPMNLVIESSRYRVISLPMNLVIESSRYRVIDRDVVQDLRVLAGMSVQSDQLKERTMRFAVDVLRLVDDLPRKASADVIGRQLAKSATSVSANYRATCNARSRAEFIAKLGVVVEEADESVGWLEMISRARLLKSETVDPLRIEAVELRAIFARSVGTARRNVAK
jgi:four helix bundle protein